MGIIKRMRRQRAVWWQRDTEPDNYGRFDFASPVEIACRWEDVSMEFLDDKGEKVMSNAMVYVDREMAVGDRLLEGELDSSVPENPLDTNEAFEIRKFEKLPNLRNTETLLTAYL